MVSLGMDDLNVNKSIRDKLNNIKQEKGLPKLGMREEAVDGKLKKASKTINEGNAISSDGLKACDRMKIEEGHTLTELGGKWQKEAFVELDEIKCEMKKIENELFRDQVKKQKVKK